MRERGNESRKEVKQIQGDTLPSGPWPLKKPSGCSVRGGSSEKTLTNTTAT